VRPSFLDLAPESELQQTICGLTSAPSSFAAHTVLLFTERRGQEPDIRPARVPAYFGRTRDEILARLGTVRMAPSRRAHGHIAPLRDPSLVLPILETLLDGPSRLPDVAARSDPIRPPDPSAEGSRPPEVSGARARSEP
jgi:hypothetical protein